MVQGRVRVMIELALVGTGKWGQNYIKTIKQLPRVELKYIFSRDYRELFGHKDIDGIIIASPARTHFQIAKECIKRNYNILVEKPMTTSLNDALELKALTKKSTSIVFIGHIYLYNPAFQKAKELTKTLGEIQYLELEGCDFGPIRKDLSALWDWGPHDISMSMEIMGTPISVSAWGKQRDMFFLCLRFKNDVCAFIKIGWLSPIKKRRMTIVGAKSSLVFDDTERQKIAIYQNGVSIDSYPQYRSEKPLLVQITEFIKCIQNKRQPKTDIENGLNVVRILHYIEKSLRQNGKEIKITH